MSSDSGLLLVGCGCQRNGLRVEMWDLITGAGQPWSRFALSEDAAREMVGEHETGSLVVLALEGHVAVVRIDETAGQWGVALIHEG